MLEGDLLILREWREPDLPALAALRNDVDLQALLMAQARPNSLARLRTWLQDRSTREDMVFFIAAAKSNDELLGYLQVANLNSFHGVGELGICFAPTARGQGLAAEACELLYGYLRKTLGLRRLTLQVLASNKRAIQFYQKSGYRQVGLLQHHARTDDGYGDVWLMERFLDK